MLLLKWRIFAQIFLETASRKLIKRKAFGGKMRPDLHLPQPQPSPSPLSIFARGRGNQQQTTAAAEKLQLNMERRKGVGDAAGDGDAGEDLWNLRLPQSGIP